MSCPQQVGDLIIPQPVGHLATCTGLPSFVMLSLTKAESHLLQVKPFTPIPHLLHLHSIAFLL